MTRDLYTYSVRLDDGSVHTGEYVGAQDGYMYLSNDAGLHRIEQRRITMLVTGPADLLEPGDE